jgi:hypothetical protein
MWPFSKSSSGSPWEPAELVDKLRAATDKEIREASPCGYVLLVRLDDFSRELAIGLDPTRRQPAPAGREDKETLGFSVTTEEPTINAKVNKNSLPQRGEVERAFPREWLTSSCYMVALPGSAAAPVTLSIGRSSSHQIALRHPSVSKLHAHLQCGSSLTLRDAESRNGTQVNGVSVQKQVVLSDRDALKFGAVHALVCEVTSLRQMLLAR